MVHSASSKANGKVLGDGRVELIVLERVLLVVMVDVVVVVVSFRWERALV